MLKMQFRLSVGLKWQKLETTVGSSQLAVQLSGPVWTGSNGNTF